MATIWVKVAILMNICCYLCQHVAICDHILWIIMQNYCINGKSTIGKQTVIQI